MFTQFSLRQTREFIDTMQAYEGVLEVEERLRANRGTLAFRVTNGHDYLVKWAYEDGKRKAKVIGKRSPETEAIERDFAKMRKDLNARAKSLQANLEQQARLNVAVGLARLPLISARIIRAFDRAGIGSERLKVVGTNALYAYEAMAGGMFETSLISTQDLDFLIDPRAPLRFVANEELREETLLGVLNSADRSFQITRQNFRAQNKDGFLVDIIKPERSPPWKTEPFEAGHQDLQPSPINGLVWLENAPAIEQRVLDSTGHPLTMHVPDPRVFAIHKYWLAGQPNREPLKARRDKAQAFAVANLVINELKHLPFDGRSLRMMPREIVGQAIAAFKADAAKQQGTRA
jgi:hypothetical protein